MKKQAYILIFMAASLVLAACAPGTVVQRNTATPKPPPRTQAPPGAVIEVPGLEIQLYAPGPNPALGTADAHGRPAGFWLGVWHGVISPFTLAASFLTRQNVQMYEVRNDGPLYNLGFFVGVLVMPAVLGIIFGWWR